MYQRGVYFSVLEKIIFLFMDLRMSYVKRQVCLKKNANINRAKTW